MHPLIQILAILLLFLYGAWHLTIIRKRDLFYQQRVQMDDMVARKQQMELHILTAQERNLNIQLLQSRVNRENGNVAKIPEGPLEATGVVGWGAAGRGSDPSRVRDL